MPFLKFASASVATPRVTLTAWDRLRSKAVPTTVFQQRSASNKVVLEEFDPSRYLLSHCTIIASVDTEESGQPTGSHMVDGGQINRTFSDYLITPETSRFVNNNCDAWERKLLLSTYPTFIGGQNYLEHIQVPELSKGRIVDAAARDVGASIYIDILVATERKHAPLIKAIETKKLGTLSMGCQISFSQCSKCGNVAEDETTLCQHIRYMKGQSYVDGHGKLRKIAELCGHHTVPDSVKFIEASWVAKPAFTGAVLRDILTPAEAHKYRNRIQVAFDTVTQAIDPNAFKKAAKLLESSRPKPRPAPPRNVPPAVGKRFDVTAFQEEFPGEDAAAAPVDSGPADKSLIDKAVDELAESLRDKAVKKIREEMFPMTPRSDLNENRNDTMVVEAAARFVRAHVRDEAVVAKMSSGIEMHRRGGWNAVRKAGVFSSVECLALSRLLDVLHKTPRLAGENRVYNTVCAVGGIAAYGDENGYLAACRRHLGRQLTGSEQDALLAKGRIYDIGMS